MCLDLKELKPNLLLNHSFDSDDYVNTILRGPYRMTSADLPMGRFRGSIFDREGSSIDCVKIVGWQKNVSRINKTDISLPTIITVLLDRDGVIQSIDLHDSFRGSKGFLCSSSYLKHRLSNKLLNVKIDGGFRKRVTVDELHCFHLVEVVLGLFSFYYSICDNFEHLLRISEKIYFEEEVTDCYRKDRDIYALCRFHISDKGSLDYTFRFINVFDHIRFDEYGNMSGLENAHIHFFINDNKVLDNAYLLKQNGSAKRNLIAFLLKCREEVRKRLYESKRTAFYNTNLYPSAIMGLVIQAIGMHLFSNNYNYNMHVLTALQRPNDTPKCIGAIKNSEEALNYFPAYKVG